MVTKSKLKMALLAEKQVDFKKLKQKKLAKNARKQKELKVDKRDEWEDMDEDSDEEEAGGVKLEADGSGDDGSTQVDTAGIDDSDSDSSSNAEGDNEVQDASEQEDEGEEEDDEDIPISDLEDLDEAEKEDFIPHQRLTINNTAALTTALKRIALPLSKWTFSEHQSITASEPVSIPDVSDDLNRELAFYSQSLSAVQSARSLLEAEGAPFSRPKDYFAEMVKADEHMAKIKAKLIEDAAGKKAAAEARKQRDLKKFGKQVQVAKLQERDKERRQTMEKIKVLKRKRQDGTAAPTGDKEADLFDVALDETIGPEDSHRDRREKGGNRVNKRQKKDEKFGFGGKKRFAKSGDAVSSGDLTGFSSRKMKGGKPGGAAKRPGKARRAKGR